MTIGYNRLGSNGRFANQMFQYAGLRGVAANKGYDFKVPPPGNYVDLTMHYLNVLRWVQLDLRILGL